jgi:hypothetical protein
MSVFIGVLLLQAERGGQGLALGGARRADECRGLLDLARELGCRERIERRVPRRIQASMWRGSASVVRSAMRRW